MRPVRARIRFAMLLASIGAVLGLAFLLELA